MMMYPTIKAAEGLMSAMAVALPQVSMRDVQAAMRGASMKDVQDSMREVSTRDVRVATTQVPCQKHMVMSSRHRPFILIDPAMQWSL